MWGAILRALGRAGVAILRAEATGIVGTTGRRPGFVNGLNIPLRSQVDTQQELLERSGYETQRVGPIVWVTGIPGIVPVKVNVPEMWKRDP